MEDEEVMVQDNINYDRQISLSHKVSEYLTAEWESIPQDNRSWAVRSAPYRERLGRCGVISRLMIPVIYGKPYSWDEHLARVPNTGPTQNSVDKFEIALDRATAKVLASFEEKEKKK